MKTATRLVILLLLLAAVASARKRDPLTEAEADQIRHAALEPQARLKLYIKFTDARWTSIEQLRSTSQPAADRGQKIHDLLEDFTALLDEINDNLDTYQGRPLTKDDRKDFRKGVKEVIAACAQWDVKLKALKSAVESDPELHKDFSAFRFAIQDAEDALKSTAEVAREYSEYKDVDEKPAKK
jgi:DNA repair exonuclease SbcCD ATPase subunit